MIACVVGARPNFIKIAPLLSEMQRRGLSYRLIHTGQHYDSPMNDVFFEQLEIPSPDVNLEIGSTSHARQTGEALIKLEQDFLSHKPELVVVVGDVNSTLAGALAAAKLNIPVAHIEAGYRSFDHRMPEEINRILVDRVSDYLFAPTDDAVENLKKEGIRPESIYLVGNIMIETLLRNSEEIQRRKKHKEFGLKLKQYGVVTIHRPENTDDRTKLTNIVDALSASSIPLVLPLHPRTGKCLDDFGLRARLGERILVSPPLPYIDMLSLMKDATCTVTDSGGVQEEACVLSVPCITIRENTERIATIAVGSNRLVRADCACINEAIRVVIEEKSEDWVVPEKWDAKVSKRILDNLDKSRGC